MAEKLTHKQEVFIEEYAKSHNGTQAALIAYDTDDERTAAAIASENLTKPNIINALEEALPDKVLLEVHREGLFATHEVWKNNNATKQIEHVSDEADFQIRAKYLDMAYKLKGSYAPEKRVVGTISLEPNDRIKGLAEKLNQ